MFRFPKRRILSLEEALSVVTSKSVVKRALQSEDGDARHLLYLVARESGRDEETVLRDVADVLNMECIVNICAPNAEQIDMTGYTIAFLKTICAIPQPSSPIYKLAVSNPAKIDFAHFQSLGITIALASSTKIDSAWTNYLANSMEQSEGTLFHEYREHTKLIQHKECRTRGEILFPIQHHRN